MASWLDQNEIYELGLDHQDAICQSNGVEYVNFPIPEQLKEKISIGKKIVIHCRMGIGRSSIITGCLLINTGSKVDDIIAHISKVRGMRVPDTDEQIAWLKKQAQ